MFKLTPTRYKIHDLFQRRWSPRVFSNKEVDRSTLMMLIEAARWAPSNFNVQPWRFIIFDGKDKSALEKVHETLDEGNYWAKKAPIMIATLTKVMRDTGEKNEYAKHDLGLATENLLLQATEIGLSLHPLAGFDKEKFRKEFKIPGEYEIMTLIALGYPGDYQGVSEEIRIKDLRERRRREFEKIVFFNGFEENF